MLPLSYNLKSIAVRWKAALLAVIGISLVVAVFLFLLAMATGFRLALRSTGSNQNAIILQQGAASELSSSFSKEAGDRVAVDPRIARGADGKSLVSSELVTMVALPRRSDGELTNVTVRGVTPAAFSVRNGIRVSEGRKLKSGLYEVVVGRGLQTRIRGLQVGQHLLMMKREFDVVGVMNAAGSAFESEIWGDFDALASVFNRAGTANSLTVRLADPGGMGALAQELRANPQLQLQVKPERQYYEDQAGPLTKFLRSLAIFVSVVMGIGAVFGAMNTMNAIVAARSREIGTLRALGFSKVVVLSAFVLEGLILAITGGIIGGLMSLLVNGLQATTTADMGEIAFAFRVTLLDLAYGIAFAATMGVIGSLLPALRAARQPIVAAMRDA